MNWLTEKLNKKEEVIFRTRNQPHQIIGSLFIALCGFLSYWFFIIAIPHFLYAIATYFYYEYVITNQRIILKKGFFYIRTKELSLNEIDNIVIRRSWSDKIIKSGTVLIFGLAFSAKKLRGLSEPEAFRNAVHSQLPTSPSENLMDFDQHH